MKIISLLCITGFIIYFQYFGFFTQDLHRSSSWRTSGNNTLTIQAEQYKKDSYFIREWPITDYGGIKEVPEKVVSGEAPIKKDQKDFLYTITPVSLADRVILKVAATFPGNASGVTQISLPVDKYGTKNIYESISSFSVTNATAVAVFEKPYLRKLHHKPGGTVTVNYTIAFDPQMSTTSSFSPIIEPEIFHFLYPQWTIRLDDDDEETFRYQINFKKVPNEWVALSNLPRSKNGTYNITVRQKDFKPFIAGGNYDYSKIEIDGKPVNVMVSYHFKDLHLIEDVRKLLKFQRSFFDFGANKQYLVSITYRDGILAGTGIENAFIALMKKGAEKYEVLQLLAHETMHNWVPLTADIYRDENEIGSEYQTEFFNEGFTTYAPRVLLFNEGLINKKEVVLMLNKTLQDYARNPFNTITLENMQKAVVHREFSNIHEKVSYNRGDLLGFIWDNHIRKHTEGKENILHFIKKVSAKAIEHKGKIQFQDFYALAAQYGIEAERDWNNYILKGEPIELEDLGWLSSDYKITRESGIFYSEGFSSALSKKEGVVSGVIEGGVAHAAGLRNGMRINDITVSKSKDIPMIIRVNENGTEKIIKYLPVKETQFQKILLK